MGEQWKTLLAEQSRSNGKLLFRLAHNVLHDAAEAEDVVQQAFLKAWQHRERIHRPEALLQWLLRTVTNESLRVARHRRVVRQAHVKIEEITAPTSHTGDGFDLRIAIEQALGQMPEATRLVVILRVMQGMSGNEVKALLGCSASEVSRRLHDGMERLRGLLASHREDREK